MDLLFILLGKMEGTNFKSNKTYIYSFLLFSILHILYIAVHISEIFGYLFIYTLKVLGQMKVLGPNMQRPDMSLFDDVNTM